MKKYVIRMIALMLFASVAVTSCSVEYRTHRREVRMHGHDDGRSHGQGDNGYGHHDN